MSYGRFKTVHFHCEIINSIVSMYLYERDSVSTVVCHLFVVRMPERSTVCSQALCVVSGEAQANLNDLHGCHFFFSSRQQAIIVQLITRPVQWCIFKIGHKFTSNDARKVGLVTIVFLGVVSSKASARMTITESFLFRYSSTSHPHLADYKVFAMVCLFLTSDTN